MLTRRKTIVCPIKAMTNRSLEHKDGGGGTWCAWHASFDDPVHNQYNKKWACWMNEKAFLFKCAAASICCWGLLGLTSTSKSMCSSSMIKKSDLLQLTKHGFTLVLNKCLTESRNSPSLTPSQFLSSKVSYITLSSQSSACLHFFLSLRYQATRNRHHDLQDVPSTPPAASTPKQFPSFLISRV